MPSLKIEELKEIQSLYNYNIYEKFIETGTYMGSTIDNIKDYFKNIYTIELNENLFNYCCKKFENDKNIKCVKGDSSIKLKDILENNKDEIVFFLDGHYSSGETSRSDKDVPLLEELEIINKYYKNKGIIIIDDLRLFETKYNEDWSNISKKKIIDKLDNIKFSLTMEKSDKFIIYL